MDHLPETKRNVPGSLISDDMVRRGSRAAAVEVASMSSPCSGFPDASQDCSLPNHFPPASLGLRHVWGLAADVDHTLHTVGAQQTQTLWRVGQGDPALRRRGGLLTKAQKVQRLSPNCGCRRGNSAS